MKDLSGFMFLFNAILTLAQCDSIFILLCFVRRDIGTLTSLRAKNAVTQCLPMSKYWRGYNVIYAQTLVAAPNENETRPNYCQNIMISLLLPPSSPNYQTDRIRKVQPSCHVEVSSTSSSPCRTNAIMLHAPILPFYQLLPNRRWYEY